MSAKENGCNLEEWRFFAQPFFDVIPTGSRSAFRAYATSRKIDRLIVSEVGFDAAVFDRDPGRLRTFESEFLLLETYDRGANRGRSDDLVTRLDARAVHVFDMARPWQTQSTDVACRSVVIPYDAIGYRPGLHPAYARLRAGSPRNAMLLAAMATLFDAGERVAPEDAEALADGFGALVRRLMFDEGGVEAEPTEGQALFARRYIDERLDQPNLGPARLCEALGVSRATLYRIFAGERGVRGYIVSRRLDRCFDELRRGPVRRGRVREVAERWGFHDPKSFNRAFRAQFGIAPSDCLDRPMQAGPGEPARHAVQEWMRRL